MLEGCAKGGNARAMFHLGYALLRSGWGLRRNKKKAAEWLGKSAEFGNGCGMALFSNCLLNGKRFCKE